MDDLGNGCSMVFLFREKSVGAQSAPVQSILMTVDGRTPALIASDNLAKSKIDNGDLDILTAIS